jgi:hypothetical protein
LREVTRILAGCLHALEEDSIAWSWSGVCDRQGLALGIAAYFILRFLVLCKRVGVDCEVVERKDVTQWAVKQSEADTGEGRYLPKKVRRDKYYCICCEKF